MNKATIQYKARLRLFELKVLPYFQLSNNSISSLTWDREKGKQIMTTEAPKVDDTKQLKLKRRSAKANVTRKGKVVEQLLEEKRSKQEVTEAFT